MPPPPLGKAVAMGLRASIREAWLLPVGMLVALIRSAAPIPALAVAWSLAMQGAVTAARLHPLSPFALLIGIAEVVRSPRFLAIVGGLWLVGAILAGAARIAFVAGALPTLGGRLAGEPSPRRFATGVAWGLPRQVATALLGGAVETLAWGYAIAVGVAVVLAVGAGALRDHHPIGFAAAAAAAVTLALAGLVAARVLSDAAAARTAILAERPGRAFAGATRRYLARPGAFTLGGLAALVAGVAVAAALQPAAGVLAAVAPRVDGLVLLGPRLMLSFAALLGAAAVDVVWMAIVGALACAEVPPPRR